MTVKKGITIALLLFVTAAIGMLIVNGITQNQSPETEKEIAAINQEQKISQENPVLESVADADVVFYFMTTQRCPSCMKIETFTKEAIEENFQKKIDEKSLLWKMINVDEQSNRHFIQDYQLFTKSVVLVKYRDGKKVNWKNLDQVWHLLGDKAAFQNYITDEVKAFIRKQG